MAAIPFLLVVFASVCYGELLTPSVFTVPVSVVSGTNRALTVSLDGNQVYKLTSNSTHTYLYAYDRDKVTGDLTFRAMKFDSRSNAATSSIYNCQDVKTSFYSVLMSCVSYTTTDDIGSASVSSRVLSLDLGTLALLSSKTFDYSTLPNVGTSIAYAAGRGTGSNSTIVGNPSAANFFSFPISNTGAYGSQSQGTPSSQLFASQVLASPTCVVWHNADIASSFKGFRVNSRSQDDASFGTSVTGLGTAVSPITGLQTLGMTHPTSTTTLQMYSVEGALSSVRLYTGTLSNSVWTFTGSSSYNLSPFGGTRMTTVTGMHIPNDDRHVYVASATALLEFRRNADNSLGFNSTFTFAKYAPLPSPTLADARGMASSPDGAYLYVNSDSTIIKYVRDAVTATPTLTAPVAGTYRAIPLKYTLPETPLSGSVFLTLVPTTGTTITLTMASVLSVDQTISPFAPVGGSVLASTSATIPTATYTVTLTYQDRFSNRASTSLGVSIVIDITTATPTLTSPTAASYRPTSIPISYTLPEAGSVGVLNWRSATTNFNWTLGSAGLTAAAHTFTADSTSSATLVSSSSNQVSAGVSLPDDTYSLFVMYSDLASNPVNYAARTGIVIDSVTQPPSWSSPTNSSTFESGTLTFNYSLPEAALPGSVKLTLAGAVSYVLTMTYTPATIYQIKSFSISNPIASTLSVSGMTNGPTIAEGRYRMIIQYQDAVGNSVQSASVFDVGIDTATLPPNLISPASSTSYKNNFLVSYKLPEAAGSVTLAWVPPRGSANPTVTWTMKTLTDVSFNYDTTTDAAVSQPTFVQSTSTNKLADDTYTVTLSYKDIYTSHSFATSVANNVIIDTKTLPCNFTAPLPGTFKSAVSFSLYFFETPQPGTMTLQFNGVNNIRTLNLGNFIFSVGSPVIFNVDPNNPTVSSNVLSVVPAGANIPDDTYTVILSYQDVLLNIAATATVVGVKFDRVTDPPTLTAPATGSTFSNPIPFTFNLPEVPLPSSVTLTITGPSVFTLVLPTTAQGTTTINVNPNNLAASGTATFTTGTSVVTGSYSAKLSYQDFLGNPASFASSQPSFSVDAITLPPTLTPITTTFTSTAKITFQFSLPEAAYAGTDGVTIKLTNTATGKFVLLTVASRASGSNSFTIPDPTAPFTTSNPTNALSGVAGTQTLADGSLSIVDGSYTVLLSYMDALNNPPSTASTSFTLDTVTSKASITSSFTRVNTPPSITVNFPEATLSGSVSFLFTPVAGGSTLEAPVSGGFVAGSSVLQVNSFFTGTLGQGAFSVAVKYTDSFSNPSATSDAVNGLIWDTVTATPSLLLPLSQTYNNFFSVSYSLPEAPFASSVTLLVTPSTTTTALEYVLASTSQTNTFPFNFLSPVDNINVASGPASALSFTSTITSSPTYSFAIRYRDFLGNSAVASAAVAGVIVNNDFNAGTLFLPTISSRNKSPLTLSYLFRENPVAGTAIIRFTSSTGTTANNMDMVLQQAQTTAGTTFMFTYDTSTNPATMPTSSFVASATNTKLNDDTYTVTLLHTAPAPSNVAGTDDTHTNVVIDTSASSPSLTLPAAGTSYKSPLTVTFNIPETPTVDTVKLAFTGTSPVTPTVTLTLDVTASGAVTFSLDTKSLSSPRQVKSVSPSNAVLNDGTYSVVLSYTDLAGNVATPATNPNVVIDTVTLPPRIYDPVDSAVYANKVVFFIPETPAAGVQLLFISPNTLVATYTLTLKNVVGAANNTLTLTAGTAGNNDPATNAESTGLVATATAASGSSFPLADGTYLVRLVYQDALMNPLVSTTSVSVRIITITPTPILTAPTMSLKTTTPLNVKYTLTTTPLASTVKVTITNQSPVATECVVTLDTATSGNVNLKLPVPDVAGSVTAVTSCPGVTSGLKTVKLEYKDQFGTVPSSVSVADVTVDLVTTPPTLSSPTTGSSYSVSIPITYTIPEAPLASSVVLTFSTANSAATRITLANDFNSGAPISFNLFPQSPTFNTPQVIGISGQNVLADGVYTVTLGYSDALANAAVTTTPITVTVDSVTAAPTLTAPASNLLSTTPLTVNFKLAENALPGQVQLLLVSTSSETILFNLAVTGTTLTTLTIPIGTDISTSLPAGITSGSSSAATSSALIVKAGTYDVTLRYRDAQGNPFASAVATSVVLDIATIPPILQTIPTLVKTWSITYTLPEKAFANSVTLKWVSTTGGAGITIVFKDTSAGTRTYNWDSSSNPLNDLTVFSTTAAFLVDGTYDISISYRDQIGNAVQTVTQTGIRLDRVTLPPVISSPAGSGSFARLALTYNLPEAPLANTPKLVLSSPGFSLTLFMKSVQSVSFVWDPRITTDPVAGFSTFVSSAVPSGVNLKDGLYNLTLSYVDQANNAEASTTISGVLIDTVTNTPTLVSPVASSSTSSPLVVSYRLGEDAQSGSVLLRMRQAAPATPAEINITLSGTTGNTLYTVSLPISSSTATFNPASQTGVASSTVTAIFAGTYSFLLSYNDLLNNPTASAFASGVNIDIATLPPSLASLPAGAATVRSFALSYTLPETPKPNTVTISFSPQFSSTFYAVVLKDTTAGTRTFAWDGRNSPAVTDPTNVLSSTVSSLDDGTYDIFLSYQDLVGNPAQMAVVASITLDRVTLRPTMTSPVTSATALQSLTVSYTLPEAPSLGSVQLFLSSSGFALTLTMTNALSVAFVWTPATTSDPTTLSGVASASPTGLNLKDGVYNITLSYIDLVGNPRTFVSVPGVTLDVLTRAPSLTAPVASSMYTGQFPISYSIPEKAKPSTVTLTLVSQTTTTNPNIVITFVDPTPATVISFNIDLLVPTGSTAIAGISGNKIIPNDRYTLTFSYQDLVGNPASTVTVTDVLLTVSTDASQRVTVTISNDYSSTIPTTASLPTFYDKFGDDVSSALGIPKTRLRFRSATASSIIVTFDILPAYTASEPTAAAVLAAFTAQYNSATSALRTLGQYTSNLVTTSPVNSFTLCFNAQQTVVGCSATTTTGGGDNKTDIRIIIGVIALILLLIAMCIGFWCHYFSDRKKKAKLMEEHNKMVTESFDKLDVNHDGTISREEWIKHFADSRPPTDEDFVGPNKGTELAKMPGFGLGGGQLASGSTMVHGEGAMPGMTKPADTEVNTDAAALPVDEDNDANDEDEEENVHVNVQQKS